MACSAQDLGSRQGKDAGEHRRGGGQGWRRPGGWDEAVRTARSRKILRGSKHQVRELTAGPREEGSLGSAVSSTVQPRGLQPAGLLCPWESPGENAGVGIPPPGGLPDPGIEPVSLVHCLLHWRQTQPLAPLGKPYPTPATLPARRTCIN